MEKVEIDQITSDGVHNLAEHIGFLEIGKVCDADGIEMDMFDANTIKFLIHEFGEKPVTEMLHRKLIQRINAVTLTTNHDESPSTDLASF